MAKKVTKTEYNEIKAQEKSSSKNKLLLPLEIIIVLFGISLISIVIMVINNSKSNNKKEKEIDRLKIELASQKANTLSQKEEIKSIIGKHDTDYIKEKLDFFDDSIVFVIDGYGKYYYSYDCMMKKTGDKSFVFWAYNKEAAIDKGYKKGGC